VTARDVIARALTELWAEPAPGVDRFPSAVHQADAVLDALVGEDFRVVTDDYLHHLHTEIARLERDARRRDT
jgi:hypothetical protein